MARLFPLLPFHADETSWSWVARMAAFHIRGSASIFLHHLGFEPIEFTSGEPGEISRFCKLAGQDPAPVLRNTLIRQNGRTHRLGEETLINRYSLADELRFCPSCLVQDDAVAEAARQCPSIHRRERLSWRLKTTRFCSVHGLALICRQCPDSQSGKGLFADSVPESTSELTMISQNTETMPVSPLQTYIEDRITGASGSAWLDGQPLMQVIRFTELLGSVFVFGPYADFEDLPARDQEIASITGWHYTSKGENGVREAFRILEAGSDPRQPLGHYLQSGPLGSLPEEIRFLSQDGPFRRLLDEHMTTHARI